MDPVPAPVAAWLETCAHSGGPIDRVHLTMQGEMTPKPGGRWMKWKGRQTIEVRRLGFRWQARLRPAPIFWIGIDDGHDGMSGWGRASLFGVFRMVNADGPDVFASQMVRNLAEIVWAPMVPKFNHELQFKESGARAFTVSAGSQTMEIELDGDGNPVRASGSRVQDFGDGYSSSPWWYTFSEPHELGGYRIPTRGEAAFELEEGLFEYWRVLITDLRVE